MTRSTPAPIRAPRLAPHPIQSAPRDGWAARRKGDDLLLRIVRELSQATGWAPMPAVKRRFKAEYRVEHREATVEARTAEREARKKSWFRVADRLAASGAIQFREVAGQWQMQAAGEGPAQPVAPRLAPARR